MSIEIIAAGGMTTVQDLGRTGWRHLGVACAGVLDPEAATLANALVGNAAHAAVLELTLHGPVLRLARPVRIALCGAAVEATFDAADGTRTAIPGGRPVDLPAGTLRLGALRGGARAWLAFAGGVDAPVVLGSRSTDLRGGFGGWHGRPLQHGDVLPLGPVALDCATPAFPAWWIDPADGARDAPVRYVPSRHPSATALAGQAWRASPRGNRQGLRLDGAALEAPAGDGISAAVAPGTVQLPPDGQPIILLADAQTVGGYARLGHVIAVDLPRLAQLRPGEAVRFAPCDARAATRLACGARARLARIRLMIEARGQTR